MTKKNVQNLDVFGDIDETLLSEVIKLKPAKKLFVHIGYKGS